MEENQWMDGLKNGDRRVVNKIYENFFPNVRHWVVQNKGTEQDAFDLFHDSLETILLKIDNVHSSFGALLLQIVKFKWYDRLKRNKVDHKAKAALKLQNEQSNETNHFEEVEMEYLKHQLLDETFKLISATCQELLRLIRTGKRVEDIVELMKFKSSNTLYRRKSACIEKWSTLVKSHNRYNELMP